VRAPGRTPDTHIRGQEWSAPLPGMGFLAPLVQLAKLALLATLAAAAEPEGEDRGGGGGGSDPVLLWDEMGYPAYE